MTDQGEALYMETIHSVLAVYRHLRRYSHHVCKESGLSGRKVAALRYLLDAEPLTVGQIVDYLYISDSTTSELLANMEEEGYVTRTRSEEDNRVVVVALTPQGREAARTTPLGGMPLLREKLKTLPVDRLTAINAALVEIKHLLEIADEQ